jgi:hypothetical protein
MVRMVKHRVATPRTYAAVDGGERRSVFASIVGTAGVGRDWREGRRDCGRTPVGAAGGDIEVYGCRGLS